MATSKKPHFFLHAKTGKGNKAGCPGPGQLIVGGQQIYNYNRVTKCGKWWKMNCRQQKNPEFKCKATASVFKKDDGSFVLIKEEKEHNHDVNEAAVIAQGLKLEMVDIVQKDPSAPVADAIKTVKKKMAEKYGNDEQLLKDISSEIGSKHSLELKLLRVREKIIGSLPKSRDRFDPKHFLKRVFKGNADEIEILDSNKLPENWRDLVSKVNPKSEYNWEKREENKKYDDSEESTEKESEENEESTTTSTDIDVEDIGPEDDVIPTGGVPMDNVLGPDSDQQEESNSTEPEEATDENESKPEEPPPAGKDLPKRVLAYSSRRLLKLFAKCIRGSLDGTFKSCCKMWGQQFVWMAKYNGEIQHDHAFVFFI